MWFCGTETLTDGLFSFAPYGYEWACELDGHECLEWRRVQASNLWCAHGVCGTAAA